MFTEGISKAGDLIDLGVDKGVVTKSGSFFSFGDTRLGQGRENAKTFLKEHEDVATEIERLIKGEEPVHAEVDEPSEQGAATAASKEAD